jgi:chromosome segregation ATPase
MRVFRLLAAVLFFALVFIAQAQWPKKVESSEPVRRNSLGSKISNFFRCISQGGRERKLFAVEGSLPGECHSRQDCLIESNAQYERELSRLRALLSELSGSAGQQKASTVGASNFGPKQPTEAQTHEIDSLAGKLRDLEESLAAERSARAELADRLEAAQKTAQEQTSMLEEKLAWQSIDLQAANNLLAERTAALRTQEGVLDEQQLSAQKADANVQEAMEEIKMLKKNISQLQLRGLSQDDASVITSLKEEIRGLESEKNALAKRGEELTYELGSTRSELHVIQERRRQAGNELAEAREEAAALSRDLAQAMANLRQSQSALEQAQADRQALLQQVREKESEAQGTKKALDDAMASTADSGKQLQQTKAELRVSQGKVAQLQIQFQDMHKQQEAHDRGTSLANQQLADARKELQDAQTKLAEAESDVSRMRSELRKRTGGLVQAERELKDAKSQLQTQASALSRADNELKKMQKQLEGHQSAAERAKQNEASLNSALAMLREQHQDLADAHAQADAKLKQNEASLKEASRALGSRNERIKVLEAQNQGLAALRLELDSKQKESEASLQDAIRSLEGKNDRIAQLEGDVEVQKAKWRAALDRHHQVACLLCVCVDVLLCGCLGSRRRMFLCTAPTAAQFLRVCVCVCACYLVALDICPHDAVLTSEVNVPSTKKRRLLACR